MSEQKPEQAQAEQQEEPAAADQDETLTEATESGGDVIERAEPEEAQEPQDHITKAPGQGENPPEAN